MNSHELKDFISFKELLKSYFEDRLGMIHNKYQCVYSPLCLDLTTLDEEVKNKVPIEEPRKISASMS